MFDKIGNKIKILSEVLCLIGILASFIGGAAVICTSTDKDANSMVLVFIIVILGCIVSWVSSFCLYGLGELIEKVTEIAENTKGMNPQNTSQNSEFDLFDKWRESGIIDEEEYRRLITNNSMNINSNSQKSDIN